MPIDRYSNYALKIHGVADSAAVVLGLLSQMGHELGSQVSAPDTGDPYDVLQTIVRQEPKLGWGSYALAAVLDKIGLTGKCITADGTHPGVVAYAARHDPCGVNGRASGNHLSVTYAKGQLVIESIGGESGGYAMVQGRMHGTTTDGSTAPYSVAYNATLPASPINNQLYGIGKPQILGQSVSRVRSVQLAYNPQIELSNDADSIWPSLVDVQKIRTLVTIVTEDPAWLDAAKVDPTGTIATHGDSAVWFLKYAAAGSAASGGAFEDFTDAVHIQGTLSGLVHITQHYDASGASPSATQIQVVGMQDGSGVAPIVWDTSAAYAA